MVAGNATAAEDSSTFNSEELACAAMGTSETSGTDHEKMDGVDRLALPELEPAGPASSLGNAASKKKLSPPSRRQRLHDILHRRRHGTEVQDTISPLVDTERLEVIDVHQRLDPLPVSDEPSRLETFVKNPVDTTKTAMRGKAAEQIAKNIVSAEIPHGQSVEVVRSEDKVLLAKSSAERLVSSHQLDELLEARQHALVRWTLDRHVTRVRVMDKESHGSHPQSDSTQRDVADDQTGPMKMNWANIENTLVRFARTNGGNYIGSGSYPPPLTQGTLSAIVERIAIGSTALQQLAMSLRTIYRWENPATTLAFLVVFLLIWVTDVILPCIIGGILYLVVIRRDNQRRIKDIRSNVQHIEDEASQSSSLPEWISKREGEDWITPLVDALGPAFLMQLGDIASLMEILQNFYEWRNKKRTAASVAYLFVLLIIVVVTPTWVLVRCFSLSLGLCFFFLFPISSWYPEYRLLVSPKTWLFWGIPTHAEWALAFVADQGSRAQQRFAEQGGHFETSHRATYDNHKGNLIIRKNTISFETLIRTNELWTVPYTSLLRMEKISGDGNSELSLLLTTTDDVEHTLSYVRGRDEAFRQIIGYAGCQWLPEW